MTDIGTAIGRIPSGIFILTARKGDETTGMLASWVNQASFEPPMFTVAVQKDRYLAGWLKEGSRVALNVLSDDEKGMISHFGRGFEPGEDAFTGVELCPDGDTAPDLVTANSDFLRDGVSVLLGNGDGSFPATVFFATESDPRSVVAADLDGDTVPDLVTANHGTDDVSVLLGNGDGSFQAAVSFAAGDGPASVAVADLDGDSVPDLVTANSRFSDVSVLLGNGDGSFQAAVSFAAGILPMSVAAADLDGDSILDLATANEYSDDVSVLLGNGDGSFQA
ncbi:MAG: VCBS repeat-containing protein, partial [Acidobacteria bacterium]|nr:VCBS repeat-containing protein [Acidobacteriota bacterium]